MDRVLSQFLGEIVILLQFQCVQPFVMVRNLRLLVDSFPCCFEINKLSRKWVEILLQKLILVSKGENPIPKITGISDSTKNLFLDMSLSI